jgi:hypothetical protein
MRRKLALIGLLLAVAAMLRWYIVAQSAEALADAAPVIFYALEPNKPLRLTTGDARVLRLGVRFRDSALQDTSSHALTLVFRAKDGSELARELLDDPWLELAEPVEGVAFTRTRFTRLVPPEGAVSLDLSTAHAGAIARLTGGREDTHARAADLRRIRVDPSLLTGEEARRMSALKWGPLPALSEAQTVILPRLLTDLEKPAQPQTRPDAPVSAEVDAEHALALNLMGPGQATLMADGKASLLVRMLGAAPEQRVELAAPCAITLDVPAGGASLLVEARAAVGGQSSEASAGASATLKVMLDGAAVLRSEGDVRTRLADQLGGDQTLRYTLDGPEPVRIWASKLRPGSAPASVHYRLLRAGEELLSGELGLADASDAFSFRVQGEQRRAIGETTQTMLIPDGADLLELSASTEVLAGADTHVTQGADATPLAPFPVPPEGLHWLFVASRAPSWVPLSPLVSAQKVELGRTSRLALVEPFVPEESSFVALRPQGGRAAELRESGAEADAREPAERRTAFEFAPGRALTLRITTKAGLIKPIYLALYRSDSSAGQLALTVDGESPRRQRGQCERITGGAQTRTLVDDGSDALLSRGGLTVKRALATLLLGDDLAAGQHVVQVRYTGPGRAWARFWTPGKRAKRERVRLWVSQEPIE